MTTNAPSAPGSPLILVAQSEVAQAQRLCHLLEEQGYSVLAARHGREALSLLQAYHPALIISDINLPEMDGYATCCAIKEQEAWRSIPIILLTTLENAEDLVRGLAAQANYYLTKPYNEQALLTRVAWLLGNPPVPDASDVAAAMEIILDGKTHTVSSQRRHMMNLLLSTYESAVQQNRELRQMQTDLEAANQQLQAQASRLQRNQANYQELLQNSADAMIVVDRAGSVRFLNPAAHALFEREDQQFLSDVLQHAETVGETIETTISQAGQEPVVAELRIVETLWADEPASLATLRDVTSHKRNEDRIQQLEAQLAKLRQSAEPQ